MHSADIFCTFVRDLPKARMLDIFVPWIGGIYCSGKRRGWSFLRSWQLPEKNHPTFSAEGEADRDGFYFLRVRFYWKNSNSQSRTHLLISNITLTRLRVYGSGTRNSQPLLAPDCRYLSLQLKVKSVLWEAWCAIQRWTDIRAVLSARQSAFC